MQLSRFYFPAHIITKQGLTSASKAFTKHSEPVKLLRSSSAFQLPQFSNRKKPNTHQKKTTKEQNQEKTPRKNTNTPLREKKKKKSELGNNLNSMELPLLYHTRDWHCGGMLKEKHPHTLYLNYGCAYNESSNSDQGMALLLLCSGYTTVQIQRCIAFK